MKPNAWPSRPASPNRSFIVPWQCVELDLPIPPRRGPTDPAYPFETIFRPEIAIRIGVGDGPRKPYFGLLDTGADDTKTPLSEAERLGVSLDRDHPTVFRGIGGLKVGYFGEVTMELRQSPRSYIWMTIVSFLPDPGETAASDRISISLGHTGFFRYFHTDFDFQRGRVKIRPNGLFVGKRR